MGWLSIPATFLGYLALQFCIALWEKHRIEEYAPEMIDSKPKLGPYLKKCDQAASQLNLIDRSVHRHLRFKLTSIFWFTPERDILIMSGQGKIAIFDAKQTWIYSALANGQYIVTSDGFDEGDPSGLSKRYRVINVPLHKLLAKHKKHLESEISPTLKFTHQTGPGAVADMKHHQAETLIQLGRAKWLNPEQSKWSYTPPGAIRVSTNTIKQLFQGLTQFWRA